MSEWKLVPVEPTEMMFSATREQYWEAFQADYSAMLAAAPDAPQAEPVFYVHLDGIRAMPPDIFAAWSPTAKQTAHEYRPVFDHPPPDELARLRAENERLRAAALEVLRWSDEPSMESALAVAFNDLQDAMAQGKV